LGDAVGIHEEWWDKKNGSKMVKNVGVAIKNRETWWNIHQKW